MFIDKDSIVINGINGTSFSQPISLGQYITECKFGYHKLWGSDSGRNLAGVMTGTLTGIFPKLTPQFRKLSKTQIETIAEILDSASQSITYYDPKKKVSITITTYTGDWELTCRGILGNEGFSCAFISTRKRA